MNFFMALRMRALLFAAKIEAAGHTRITNRTRSARVAARPSELRLYFAANRLLRG
jgi:hypothetical protein